jgi:hypothetical protein
MIGTKIYRLIILVGCLRGNRYVCEAIIGINTNFNFGVTFTKYTFSRVEKLL